MIEIIYTAKNFKFKNCLIEIFIKKIEMLWKWKFLGVEKRKTQHT